MVTRPSAKLARLQDAVTHHYRQLDKLRQSRELYLKSAAGSLYPHGFEMSEADILNLMKQASEAQALSLAANRPRVLAVAKTRDRMQFAEHYANAINAYAKLMHLEEVLQDCARQAFFCLGVAKVFMADAVPVQIEADEWMDPGQPYVQSLSMNHLAYDTDATDWRYCSFIADRYRVRFEDVVDNPLFSKSSRDRIKTWGPNGRFGEDTESLSDGTGRSHEFEDTMYLCDVFLPKDGVIFTFLCDDAFRFDPHPLAERDWDGSEMGPYRFLNLGPVPDKTTPSSPAQNLLLQHNLVNSLYRKLQNQAVRQKQIVTYDESDEDLATKGTGARDGEWIPVPPNSFEQLRFDGPDQNVFGFMLNAQQQFSKAAGNLEHKLGLAASADTASQQSMIGENVSRMEAFYQGRFVSFTREVVKELARLLFADSTTTIPMTRQIPGTSFTVDAPWRGAVVEGSRLGEFTDYDIDIEPYSMEYRSPQQRLAQIDQQVQMIMPLVPLLMQQGKMLDLNYWLKTRAKYSDMPELEWLITDIPRPPQQERQGNSHERLLPVNNGGEYIHRNVSSGGGSPEAEAMQLMSAPEG